MGVDGVKEGVDIYEGIDKFENTMFISNPIRGMKFGQFLANINTYGSLRNKLLYASKGGCFWQISDAYENVNSERFEELGLTTLPKYINDFLDELEKNDEIDFSRNEIEEVKNALANTFQLNKTKQTKAGIKDRIFSFLK